VDVFFVISGFIMIYTSAGRERSSSEFWRDRAIRILPLYWLALFAMIAVHSLGYHPFGLHRWDAADLLTSLLLLPHVRLDGATEPILGPAWTLIYEVFFYFLFGLFLAFRDLVKTTLALAAVFVGLCAGGFILQPASFAIRHYTNPIVLEFVAGCLLGLCYVRSRIFENPQGTAVGIALIGVGAAALVLADYRLGVMAMQSRLLYFGIPAAMIVAGALALEKAGHRYSGRGLLLLGGASYAIYLVHPLVLHFTFAVVAAVLPGGSALASALYVCAAILALTAIGVVVHRYLEIPITWFLRVRARPRASVPQV
jgi:peptidoglycan/LPS O-acetylase OafA/YrhL